MRFVREILETAFSDLAPGAVPLVLTPDVASAGYSKAVWASVDMPSNIIPTGSNSIQVAADERFVKEAQAAITSTGAQCVLAIPPIGSDRFYSDAWRNEFASLGIPEVLASHVLGGSDSSGTELFTGVEPKVSIFAMLVPSHFLSLRRTGRWRQDFFGAHSALVIEDAPQTEVGINGGAAHIRQPLCLVIFRREPGPNRFFKITDEAASLGAEQVTRDFNKLLRQPAGKTHYGYVHASPIAAEYPCTFDFYSEATATLRQQVGALGEKVVLSSAADVLTGLRPCRPDRLEDSVTGVLQIGGRDITSDGRVDLSDLQKPDRPSTNVNFLQEGDFCVRRMYRGDSFVVGLYEGGGENIAFADSVIVVRPKVVLNDAQRQVLFQFLRSPLAHRLNNVKESVSSLAGAYRVSPDILREFPVPLADPELASAVQQLSEAKAAFQRWIAEAQQGANAILLESSAEESRRSILNAGQLARQRCRAGLQVEEFDYRVRTQFPFPLAYVWRELQVAGSDRYRRLRAVTKAAEAHTCFIAQVAILLSRASGKPISYVSEIGKRLSQRKGGTNFGDWVAVLKEVNESRTFQKLEGVVPFAQVTQLMAGGRWEPAINALKALRNDDSHNRISPSSVSAEQVTSAEASLEALYGSTEFLTDFKLMYLTETRFDSLSQVNHFQYCDLTGDNGLPSRHSDTAGRADLEANSLYLRDRQGILHLLRPLLHYLECPECHQMSTFYLDTFDPNSAEGRVGLKSFERNSVREEPIAEQLRQVGMLPTR